MEVCDEARPVIRQSKHLDRPSLLGEVQLDKTAFGKPLRSSMASPPIVRCPMTSRDANGTGLSLAKKLALHLSKVGGLREMSPDYLHEMSSPLQRAERPSILTDDGPRPLHLHFARVCVPTPR